MYCKIIRPKILSEPIQKSDSSIIPKGNGLYAHAKKAHIIDKDLNAAEKLYRLAISNGEKVSSAIKDLSNVLHQQGRTSEACDFLERHKHLCKHGEQQKIENLLCSLRKQLIPTGNYLNRTLVLFNTPESMGEEKIKNLFENCLRIGRIEFISGSGVSKLIDEGYAPIKDHHFDKPEVKIQRACMVHFPSNSAARKTLDTLIDEKNYQFYWMSEKKKIVRLAEPYKRKDNESNTDSTDSSEKDLEITSFQNFELSTTSTMDYDSCWNSLVFPSIEEKRIVDNGVRMSCVNEFDKMNKLWQEIGRKKEETKTTIMKDPNFVNGLLWKTFSESSRLVC